MSKQGTSTVIPVKEVERFTVGNDREGKESTG
jgi:hypothetical protein